MKTSKLLTLDSEIVEELKKIPNASGLINEMLKDYFNQSGHLRKEELKKKLEETRKIKEKADEDLEILNEQIRKIDIEEKRIKEIFKDIPNEIIEDFKFYDKMTVDTLLLRYKEVYSRKWSINFEEIKKAFCEFKGIKEEENAN